MEARGTLKCTSLCVMRYLHMNILQSSPNFCFCNLQLPWGTSDTAIINRQVVPLHAMKVSLHTTHGTSWVPNPCMQQCMAQTECHICACNSTWQNLECHMPAYNTQHMSQSEWCIPAYNKWRMAQHECCIPTHNKQHLAQFEFCICIWLHMTQSECYIPVYSI